MTTTTPLTRASVLEAALEVLDDQGLAGLSLRSLAARLGVSAMAPYRHYENKAELLDALAAHALAPLQQHDDLEAAMRGLHRRLVAHRGLVELLTLRPRLPQLAEARRHLLEGGHSAGEVRIVTAYVIGYAMLTPEGDDAFDEGLRRLLDER